MELQYRVEAVCRDCGHFVPPFEAHSLAVFACPQCGGELEVVKAEKILLA